MITGTIVSGPRAADGSQVVTTTPYAYSNERTKFSGHFYTCPPGTSQHSTATPGVIRLQGGTYWARGATAGDRVTFEVVDADNVLGGGAGAVVSQYVSELPVAPWDHHIEVSSPNAGTVPAGLYLRITYVNTGASDVQFGVTYRWYQQ
jgi:hypothetical protein